MIDERHTHVQPLESVQIMVDSMRLFQAYWTGVWKYTSEFMQPFWIALQSFLATERDKVLRHQPLDTLKDYLELLQFNLQVANQGFFSSIKALGRYQTEQAIRGTRAWYSALAKQDSGNLARFVTHEADVMEKVVFSYPKAIWEIRPEYGFHFDSGGYELTAETERFLLYQVLPRNGEQIRPGGKPILIIPPYVLGANILAFLPGENKSYVHAYANQGIPTYIRIMKDIQDHAAVQTLTGEEDVLDTRYFCEKIQAAHGRRVTLNGFCQGGFVGLAALLSGELDDLVDAFIACVAPMDGTRSKALVEYMQHLPPRFRDLGYAVKLLPTGHRVVDGKVMSWVYKLKSMDQEAPLFTLYRDLMLLGGKTGPDIRISKTAAAINHWLLYDRGDLPEPITRMSFDSYTKPTTPDGTLPVTLFGRRLSYRRLQGKGFPFLICYGERDELVDKEAALAPLDFIDAEVTVFPKGHGAIATSWSDPKSEFALHKRFPDGSRGPVRFQLDLEAREGEEAPAAADMMREAAN